MTKYISSIVFSQINIENTLNIKKFHSSQQPLKNLIQIVKSIKSNEIYGFYGIGTMSHSWNYMMYIYCKNNNYYLEIYEENLNKKIQMIIKEVLSIEKFDNIISTYEKKWNFDKTLIYSSI